jgi:CRP-like cAMP-binding protein
VSIPPPPHRAQQLDYVRAYLMSLPFFDELSIDRIREVARQIQVVERDAGDVLFEADAPAGPMLLVTSGAVQIERAGRVSLKTTVHERSVFGAVSALYAERRLARATATGPLELFAFAPSLVRGLVREFSALRGFLDRSIQPRVPSLLLQTSPQLSALKPATRAALLAECEIVSVDDSTLLQLEGGPARALQFVVAGSIEVFGEPMGAGNVERWRAGATLGADSLRENAPAPCTARTAGPALMARLDRAAYRTFVAEHPDAREVLRDGPGA